MENKISTAAELREVLAKAETIESIKALAELGADLLDSKEQEVTAALRQVSELGAKLDTQEKVSGDGSIVVTVKKKDYKILGNRFVTRKGEYNAEKLSKDKELLEEMVEKGSGSLQLIK